MQRFSSSCLFFMLAAGLGVGCQSYSSIPDTGVEEDGEPSQATDELPDDPGWPWGDDDDYPDCCGPDDGDPGWWPEGDPWRPDRDGPVDGGDQPQPGCPQVAGEVWVTVECAGMESVERGSLVQGGCDVQLEVGGFSCFGQVQQDGVVLLACPELGQECRGRVHRGGLPFGLECDPGCTAGVYPVQGECYDHAGCNVGQSCQLFVDNTGEHLVTGCWYPGGPGHDNTGAHCEEHTECFSAHCLDESFCAGLCMPIAGCPPVQLDRACTGDADCRGQARCDDGWCTVPSTCQTRLVYMGPDPDGGQMWDWVNWCLPEGRACESDRDCPLGVQCMLQAEPTSWEGFRQRCGPRLGDGGFGSACDGCGWNVCVPDGAGGYCSWLCETDDDCSPQVTGARCELRELELVPDYGIQARVCVRP